MIFYFFIIFEELLKFVLFIPSYLHTNSVCSLFSTVQTLLLLLLILVYLSFLHCPSHVVTNVFFITQHDFFMTLCLPNWHESHIFAYYLNAKYYSNIFHWFWIESNIGTLSIFLASCYVWLAWAPLILSITKYIFEVSLRFYSQFSSAQQILSTSLLDWVKIISSIFCMIHWHWTS